MSTVDGVTLRPRDVRAGHTLLEIVIVVVILSAVVFLTYEGIDAGVKVNDQMSRTNRLNVLGHDVLARIEADLARSHRVFTESTATRDLLKRLDDATESVLDNSLLPVVDSDGILERDAKDTRRTGNMLLFAASIPPLATDVSGSEDPEKVVRVDLYRFVLYHLRTHKNAKDFSAQAELARWASQPVASYNQVIKGTTVEERERLVDALDALGVVALWDSTADSADDAFYPIVLGDINDTPDEEYLVPKDWGISEAGLTAHKHAGVATEASDAPDAKVFAPEGSKMPPGFEVKMIGPASARQVLVNVTLVTKRKNRPPLMLRRSIIVGARDM